MAVFAGIRGPARTFTYAVPPGLELLPGHLVAVPLGPLAARGVVLALDVPWRPGGPLRPVTGLVHPLPLLHPHQLALARWVAERYRCGQADAVRAMLPPALAARSRGSALAPARGGRTEAVFGITAEGRAALAAPVAPTRLTAKQLATLRALAAGAVTGAELAEAGASA
ncbi:MAG: hypothetical protein Q7S25_05920, partial [Candidatus Limnocylindria bacterium]|nr:hypothetical protein [Candidatus Limnocylindria bacterium]